MKTKLVLYFVIISFFFNISAFTQEILNPDSIIAKMETVLNLTSEQAVLLKPIIKEYTARRNQLIKDFREQGTLDKSILSVKLKQLKEEENQKLSQVLTQAQIKKWSNHQTLTNIMNQDDPGGIPDSPGRFDQGGMEF